MTCYQVQTPGGNSEKLHFVCLCRSEAGVSAGTHFQRLIPDVGPAADAPQKVKRLIFCTGKIYYELVRERTNCGLDAEVAIVRVEQVTSHTVRKFHVI